MTWFMILYLSTGGIKAVVEVPGPIECAYRSQFEQRFDHRVSSTYCMLAFKDYDA